MVDEGSIRSRRGTREPRHDQGADDIATSGTRRKSIGQPIDV
jgi:hypothetical protein